MDEEDIMSITHILYSKWSQSADNLNAVKREKNDGSPDWEEFHQERLNIAGAHEFDDRGLFERWKSANETVIRTVTKRMMGE